MNISETYIVINSLLVSKLKQIKHFELNLGTSLLNGAKQFLPSDVKIQKHYIYFNENILLVGYIGSLAFYTNNRLNTTFIELYNEKDVLIYALTGIDLLLGLHGFSVQEYNNSGSGSNRGSSRGSDSRGSTRGESSRGSNSRGTER